MQILSHRGYWLTPEEKNEKIAFERSFDMGYGTETDLRDFKGEIVIAHDMPHGNEITFEEVLQLMNGRNLPLALNIKADGQIDKILTLLEKYNHTNYFTFDMAIPDMVVQVRKGAKVFAPLSDIVPTPILLKESVGVWLDCFKTVWYKNNVIEDLISSNKEVCIVSSDLHKRDNKDHWTLIKNNKFIKSDKLYICTDKLEEAIEFFG